MKQKSGHPIVVDCYVMELFPDLKSQLFRPTQELLDGRYNATGSSLRLHVMTPLNGTRKEWAKHAGINEEQVVYEPLLPVHRDFLTDTLPHPGEAVEVILRASTPQEEAFLGGTERAVSILAEDTVTLVDFGARPDPETVRGYAARLLRLGPVQPKGSEAPTKGLHWVFIGTGSSEWREHTAVHNASAALAQVFNSHQEEAGGRMRLLPFSHQVAALRRLKGRSDVIVTWGASSPCGELLALARRGDARHILIEVGGIGGLAAADRDRMKGISWWEHKTWEKTAFLSMKKLEARNYRYLSKKIGAALTTIQSLPEAWEDAGGKVGGFCTDRGACNTQLWDAASACLGTDPRCARAVSSMMAAARNWTLLLTSSGGGGHMVAASVLGKSLADDWHRSLASATAELKAAQDLLRKRAYEQILGMAASAEKAGPVNKIDLMESPCTNLLGEHGLGMGKAFSGVWNLGQSMGSVKALTGMSKAQGLEDGFFHTQCQRYMRNVIGGNRLNRVGPPNGVVSCQPMQHAAIAEALREVSSEAEAELRLDIYLTELPTTHSVTFFDPLRTLVERDPEAARLVRLHAVAPADGGVEMIAGRTGLNASQIVIEDCMPVDVRLRGADLARPGSAASITLEAGSPRELAFLGRQRKTFSISAEDSITLVMLGSQPTVGTMREYAQRFVQSTPQDASEKPAGLHWIFLATGNPKQPSFDKLYIFLADLADRFNFLQRMTNGRLRLVPFTRQPVTQLESRADVTLTRSGGITSGELLAMSKRGDRRKVLLHIEVPKDKQSVEPEVDSEQRKSWEKMALTEGMVEWEMGNALHLQQVLNATLVTPKKLPSVW
uniref:Uncharacterized protein n=2 Tax=Alexandrium monilatum TaxID=311494 RepID=A0A7S4PUR1_9DINO